MINADQVKAARGMLDWSRKDLADKADLNMETIKNFENGDVQIRKDNLDKIKNAIEKAGIEFIEGGIRRAQDQIQILENHEGMIKFFDDVYLTVKEKGGEILVSGVSEDHFDEIQGDYAPIHMAKMTKIAGTYTCRSIISENDHNYKSAAYTEYRKIPEQFFAKVPFYIYGKKLAIILWEEKKQIIVLNHPSLTEAYIQQFNALWEMGESIA